MVTKLQPIVKPRIPPMLATNQIKGTFWSRFTCNFKLKNSEMAEFCNRGIHGMGFLDTLVNMLLFRGRGIFNFY